MKRNKLILVFASLAIAAASCKKDFLEEKRDLSGVNEEVFQNPVMAKAYVDYVYFMFQPGNNATSFTWELATNNDEFTRTTEEIAGETNYNKEWAQVSFSNGHALQYFGTKITSSLGNNTWTRMKEINLFLDQIDKYGLPLDTRRELKGQMYFWRAWQYFDLVRLYGGVPLVLHAQDPINSGGENLAISRSKTSECIAQITADLDSAIAMLPGKWTSADWGRITSGAAAAFKGRVLLTWASPLFNRNDDQNRWKAAYDANLAAKTLLEANGFGLFKAGGTANGKAWGDMWFKEVDNPEAVIVYGFNNATSDQTMRNNGWEQAARSRESGGGGSISPTKQMVDAFPMKDGKMPGESSYSYDVNKFYKNRDPRFYKTFVYNGAAWPYNGNPNFRQWTYQWFKSAGDTTKTPNVATEKNPNSSGIYLSKATSASASNTNGDFKVSGTDYMEMRFAEVVLNLAESAIGIGNIAEGIEGIKAIRERAGVENVDGAYGLSGVTSRDQAFAAVLNERKVEFAYEGKRFWDLRRWMLFNNDFGTCSRLGVQPLNGTRRTGYYIIVKKSDGKKYVGSSDPLVKSSSGSVAVVEREPANMTPSQFEAHLDYLYDNHFQVVERDNLDKTSPANWAFKWYNEYYFFGLHQNILTSSPYLEQTQGWNSLTGTSNFDPLQ